MQSKRRRNKTSKFIPNLRYFLYQDKDSGAFWTEDGRSFVLANTNKLISNSLLKYFRHSNISSFIRQLNLYGFKKIVGEEIQENAYYHQKFKQNMITQLKPIRSFYNQQKYGSVRKTKKTGLSVLKVQNIQKNPQPSLIVEVEQADEINQPETSYKQKSEILQKQNARLRTIQKQHICLLHCLNTMSQPCQGGTNLISNNFQRTTENGRDFPFASQNFAEYGSYSMGAQSYNWPNNSSIYYIPFWNRQ